jgi:hypothetical protein
MAAGYFCSSSAMLPCVYRVAPARLVNPTLPAAAQQAAVRHTIRSLPTPQTLLHVNECQAIKPTSDKPCTLRRLMLAWRMQVL